MGSREGGSTRQLPVCRENDTLVPPRTQTRNGQMSGEAVQQCSLARTLPTSTSLLVDDPTASPGAVFCRAVRSPGAGGFGAQSPLVSMAVTEAGVEEREVAAEVLSRAGLGTLQSVDLAEPLPPGSSGRLWLWGLWPCRFWPQRRWCRSQSLCWQKEPQYRAILQPLQVSLALRPQFQQFCKTQASVSCLDLGRQARLYLSPAL